MTDGYYLSTSWSQHFHQISLVCSRKTQKKAKKNPEETQGNKRDFRVVSVCRLPQFFRLSVLFNQGISRSISVIFPLYFRCFSRHVSDEFPMNFPKNFRSISTVYNHGMVLVFG